MDNLLTNKELQLLGQQYEDEVPTCDFTHYALDAQNTKTLAKIREAVEGAELTGEEISDAWGKAHFEANGAGDYVWRCEQAVAKAQTKAILKALGGE